MARLPKPGSDTGNWGNILNEYLLVTHRPDGNLRPGAIANSNISPGAITAPKMSSGSGTNGQVLTYDSTVAGNMAWRPPSSGGTVPDATSSTKGILRLTGDLSGTADSPSVPGLTAKYEKPTAGIPASDLEGGITSSLLDSSVQDDLELAGTSVQSVNSVLPNTSGVVTLNASDIGAPTDLDGLSDVSTTGVADGQVLQYDSGSSSWAPATVSSTTVSDASSTVKGIVQLTGDLGGTAASPSVSGVNGVAVSGTPTSGQVLTASGASAASWTTPATGGAVELADLPAGSMITVFKSGGTWPVRPTSRTDIVVRWKGESPGPAIDGTYALDNVDDWDEV